MKDKLALYVAHLSKLICGEESCHRKIWNRMRGKKEKEEIDKRLALWKANHTNMIMDFAEKLEGGGNIKREHWIGMDILNGELRGSIDLLHEMDKEVKIYEFKGAKETESHHFQTLIYLFMLKKSGLYKGKEINSTLHYNNRKVQYGVTDIPEDMQELLERHAKILLNESAPKCTCGRCEL